MAGDGVEHLHRLRDVRRDGLGCAAARRRRRPISPPAAAPRAHRRRPPAARAGWTALPDVNNPGRKRDDKMESFVLAETLKYIYLLFDPDYPIPLEKYVMNTEAHPLGHIPLPPWAEGGGTAAAS